MRKIFAGMILVLALCGVSQADFAYITADGKLGIIGVQGLSIDAPAVHYSGFSGCDFISSFWNGHESQLIAVSRTTDTTASGDSAFIFGADSISSTMTPKKRTLRGIYNTQTAVSSQNGRGLFFASGENASIVELNTETFAPVRSFQYKPDSSDGTPHMQKILMDYSGVSGLVSGGGKSTFLRFDGQLKANNKDSFRMKIDSESYSMAWLSGMRIAVAVPSGIGLLGSGGFRMAVSSDVPVKDLCRSRGSDFFFITQAQSGDEYSASLYRCYSGDIIVPVKEGEPGENCQLVRHTKRGVIAAVLGEKIIICDTENGMVLKEYTSADLGGVPVYASNRYARGDDDETSHGSCSVSDAGVILLLSCMAGMMMMKLKE